MTSFLQALAIPMAAIQTSKMDPQKGKEIKDVSQWIISIFKRSWLAIEMKDFFADFSKGLIIIQLAQVLVQKKLPILFPEPKNLAERIGNIETALLVFKDDGVQCPGIFANDIAHGDQEIIIAFCYILKYHYSREELSHWCNMACDDRLDDLTVQNNQAEFLPYEKEDIAVFDWVSHQIGIKVHDYSCFQDGILLCKLINKILVRKIPEKMVAYASKSERFKLAFDFAANELRVGIRLEPNDIIKGPYRKVIREYVWMLKRIKSKQQELLMSRLENFEEYSHVAQFLCLKHPVHQGLYDIIYRRSLYEKAIRDSKRADTTTIKEKVATRKKRSGLINGELILGSNDFLKDGSTDQVKEHDNCWKIKQTSLLKRLDAVRKSINRINSNHSSKTGGHQHPG